VSDPVTYTPVLPVAEETVHIVSRLLATEQRRRRTRRRRRALGCHRQVVLVLRWFVDGPRLTDLDLARAARPGARHHRPAGPSRSAPAAGRVDRQGSRRPRRSGL
jgi:hypothetical protein